MHLDSKVCPICPTFPNFMIWPLPSPMLNCGSTSRAWIMSFGESKAIMSVRLGSSEPCNTRRGHEERSSIDVNGGKHASTLRRTSKHSKTVNAARRSKITILADTHVFGTFGCNDPCKDRASPLMRSQLGVSTKQCKRKRLLPCMTCNAASQMVVG